MTDIADPWNPQPQQQAAPQALPPQPQQGGGLFDQWNMALQDPKVRSALTQFGVSLLSGAQWGDTFGSQVGRAIGDVGGMYGRQTAEDIATSEATSKQDLRKSQADAAAERALYAGQNADLRREGLDIARQKMDLQQTLRNMMRHNEAQKRHEAYVQQYNNDKLLNPKLRNTEPLRFDQWAAQNGYGDVAYGPNIAGFGPQTNKELMWAMDAIRGDPANGRPPKDINAVRKMYERNTGTPAPF